MMVHNEHIISEREQDINQINKQVKEVPLLITSLLDDISPLAFFSSSDH
jgi:hypothetical protein